MNTNNPDGMSPQQFDPNAAPLQPDQTAQMNTAQGVPNGATQQMPQQGAPGYGTPTQVPGTTQQMPGVTQQMPGTTQQMPGSQQVPPSDWQAYENRQQELQQEQQDKKSHVGIIVAIVAFVCLIIIAGIAYANLAPAGESRDPIDNPDINVNISTNENTTVINPDNSNDAASNSTNSNSSADSNRNTGSTSGTSSSAQLAPAFTVYDLDNNKVSLDDYAGQPVVLNFWASWCTPCRSEMPEFQSMYEKYGDQVQFLMVDMTGMNGETKGDADMYVADNGFTFPVFYDDDSSAATAFGITSIPQTYFINADGEIVASQIGSISSSALERNVESLLK